MKLGDYLQARSLSQTDFARLIGCSPSSVSKWLSGGKPPKNAMIMKIAAATDWQVSPDVWFDRPDNVAEKAA